MKVSLLVKDKSDVKTQIDLHNLWVQNRIKGQTIKELMYQGKELKYHIQESAGFSGCLNLNE